MRLLAVRLPRYVLPLVLGLAALAVVYGRFLLQARDAVHAGRTAAGRGDLIEATRCYLDALRAYVPGSPFEPRALDELADLAGGARTAGDSSGERAAWEAMRVGLSATRSLYTPHRARLLQAQRRLAELDAAVAPFRGGRAAEGSNAWTLPPGRSSEIAVVSARGNGPGRSVRPLGPAIGATLISLAGFALWVSSVVLLIRRGVDNVAGPPRPGRPTVGRDTGAIRRLDAVVAAAPWLLPVMFVAGFALFLLGLRFG